jgi:ribosomal-protein-alanine N-acetyltransferase
MSGEAVDWGDDLTDGVVLIRLLTPEDAPAFAQGFVDDPTLGAMVGTETDPTAEEVLRREFTDRPPNAFPALAIADPATKEFLGGIGIYRLDRNHRRGEVGFWLRPQERGRGLVSRAVRLLTTWGFETLGLDRMELTTTPDNGPTRALALKLGFTEEGTMRARNFERGRRVDVMMFAVLKDEWRG